MAILRPAKYLWRSVSRYHNGGHIAPLGSDALDEFNAAFVLWQSIVEYRLELVLRYPNPGILYLNTQVFASSATTNQDLANIGM
jgi:hypothetical protein